MPAKNKPIFTYNFFLVTFINFMVFFCFQMIFPVLPLYVQQLGGNDATVGMVLGIFTFSTIIARPWAGYLLDKHDKKYILIASLTVFAIAIFSYGLAASIAALMMVRILHGFGWGFAGTTTSTIASEMMPKDRFGEGMGYFSLANSLAMALAPATGIYIGKHYGDVKVFFLATIFGLCAFAAAFFLKCRKPNLKVQKSKMEIYERKAIMPGVMLFLVAMAYGAVISFLPLFALQRGVDNVGIFFVVYALAILLTRPLTGKMVDRLGFDYTIIPGFACLLVGLFLLANLKSETTLIWVALIYGTGLGAMITSLQTMALRDVAHDHIGAANATLFTGNDLGIGLGVMFLGTVAEKWGYRNMYLFTIIPLMAAMLFYMFYARTKKSKTR